MDCKSRYIIGIKCITQSLGDIQTESTVSDARLKARSYLRMLQSSPFIVALVVAQHILSFTRPLTQALQQTDCYIIMACNDANRCKTVIQKERSEAVFESLWGKMTALADRIDVQLEKPRAAIRMKHRSTAGDANDTACLYFKVNVFFPFIDHCVAQLEERFPEDKSAMFLASKLMPNKIRTMTSIEMAKVFEWYSPDLPEGSTFQMEIQRWKDFCDDLNDTPKSLAESFVLSDPEYYPDIHEIFHILLTMPVGSVPCERSISALRRFKSWNRTTMTEDRLNGLALLHTHKDKDVDRVRMLDKFDASGSRRIGALHL